MGCMWSDDHTHDHGGQGGMGRQGMEGMQRCRGGVMVRSGGLGPLFKQVWAKIYTLPTRYLRK